ncbi:hypothetical protein SAMN06265379_11537 [Saccharicrinis carchari]|uniref:Uncharacterized protein n=1 Tax=Saccharicrinis carchari TaxID=1168039 RepID=A0A521F708_SACCC|nr:hypothetical protein SAMN06265379_11537 [Saccharicrinis carchari]
MIVATFGGAWLIHELIPLKVPMIQPLFEIKRTKTIADKM